jgi:hypothetical protein
MNIRSSGNGERPVSAPLPGQAAQQWVDRLTTISRNLMELSEAETTKIIRARLKDPVRGYRGVTREKADRGVAMLDHLLQQYVLLTDVVNEAADLAKKSTLFHNYDARINELLYGPSVVMAQEQVDLHARGLLDDGQRVVRATPAQVLAQMEQSFAGARDTLTAIAAAMVNVQPRLTAVRDKMTKLDEWAKSLGVTSTATMPAYVSALAVVESDPLGGTAEIDRIDRSLTQRRDELQAIDAERKEIIASIERGKTLLTALQDQLARASSAFAEARQLLADQGELVPPAGDDAITSLGEWLSTLAQNATSGRFAAVKVGMVKWERECTDRLNAARASYERNRALLDEMDELKGRFTASSAKANVLRRRGVVLSDAVEATARQAQVVLDAVPFAIRAARSLVEAFEVAVSAASRSS